MTARELIVNMRGGARVCVPADIRQYTPYVLLEQEDWFEDEIRFVRRWLREGMRAVDAGASYGVYTLAMARAVGESGRVWAFEPTAEVAAYLERSVVLNGLRNVTVRRAAVSDRAGSIEFASGVYPELNAVGGQGTVTRVDAVTLDEQGWNALDFLKIDIEGHEAQAIRGAQRLLRDTSPLVMLELKARASFDARPLRLLADMGYAAYRLLPGPLVLCPVEPGAVSEFQLNAFACKPDRAAQLAQDGWLTQEPRRKLPPPPKDAWLSFARCQPYASDLWRKWSSQGGPWLTAHRKTYLAGLQAYALSRETGRTAVERVAWLFLSLDYLRESLELADTVARRLSYARVAHALGRRQEAGPLLFDALSRLEPDARRLRCEPWLAPSERSEQSAASPALVPWLRCAMLEQIERARAFSSRFDLDGSEPLVQAIVDLEGHSPEMDRRLQLIRMLKGRQQGPMPAAALRGRSEDNLNPDYWAGRA